MALSSLSYQFEVDSLARSVGKPTPHTVFNHFDEFGIILGLERLRAEEDASYRTRLFDVFAHRANSTLKGIVFGITRELGLSLFNPLEITCLTSDSTGNYLARDPLVAIDGPFLVLYSDYTNQTIDLEFDLMKPGGNFEFLGRLVDGINTSTYFRATLLDEKYRWKKSLCLYSQRSREFVLSERFTDGTILALKNSPIVKGSLIFSNSSVFREEVSTKKDAGWNGKYWVDYTSGAIKVFSPPDISSDSVSYWYHLFPWKPQASPVVVQEIPNKNFQRKMFQQILQDDGTYKNGLPTELGVDIMNELFSVYPAYWGK